jgi:hypothetical protein
MKTSELTGPALDWAVSQIEGHERAYSTDWAHGGPIIEEEGMSLNMEDRAVWHAAMWWDGRGEVVGVGSTPLVAAMRCFVTSRMGDTIEVPEGL